MALLAFSRILMSGFLLLLTTLLLRHEKMRKALKIKHHQALQP